MTGYMEPDDPSVLHPRIVGGKEQYGWFETLEPTKARWLMTPRLILRDSRLKPGPKLLLMLLMDETERLAAVNRIPDEDDVWVHMTATEVENALGIARDSVRRYADALVELDLIEVRYKQAIIDKPIGDTSYKAPTTSIYYRVKPIMGAAWWHSVDKGYYENYSGDKYTRDELSHDCSVNPRTRFNRVSEPDNPPTDLNEQSSGLNEQAPALPQKATSPCRKLRQDEPQLAAKSDPIREEIQLQIQEHVEELATSFYTRGEALHQDHNPDSKPSLTLLVNEDHADDVEVSVHTSPGPRKVVLVMEASTTDEDAHDVVAVAPGTSHQDPFNEVEQSGDVSDLLLDQLFAEQAPQKPWSLGERFADDDERCMAAIEAEVAEADQALGVVFRRTGVLVPAVGF